MSPRPEFFQKKRVRLDEAEAAEILRCVHKEHSDMVAVYWYPDRDERLTRLQKIMEIMIGVVKSNEERRANEAKGDGRS